VSGCILIICCIVVLLHQKRKQEEEERARKHYKEEQRRLEMQGVGIGDQGIYKPVLEESEFNQTPMNGYNTNNNGKLGASANGFFVAKPGRLSGDQKRLTDQPKLLASIQVASPKNKRAELNPFNLGNIQDNMSSSKLSTGKRERPETNELHPYKNQSGGDTGRELIISQPKSDIDFASPKFIFNGDQPAKPITLSRIKKE